jgi:hypothetical protein
MEPEAVSQESLSIGRGAPGCQVVGVGDSRDALGLILESNGPATQRTPSVAGLPLEAARGLE